MKKTLLGALLAGMATVSWAVGPGTTFDVRFDESSGQFAITESAWTTADWYFRLWLDEESVFRTNNLPSPTATFKYSTNSLASGASIAAMFSITNRVWSTFLTTNDAGTVQTGAVVRIHAAPSNIAAVCQNGYAVLLVESGDSAATPYSYARGSITILDSPEISAGAAALPSAPIDWATIGPYYNGVTNGPYVFTNTLYWAYVTNVWGQIFPIPVSTNLAGSVAFAAITGNARDNPSLDTALNGVSNGVTALSDAAFSAQAGTNASLQAQILSILGLTQTNLFAGAGTTGLVTSAAADAGKFLYWDGTWNTPAGAGDMLASIYDPATQAMGVVFTNDSRLTNARPPQSHTAYTVEAGWGMTNAGNSTNVIFQVRTNFFSTAGQYQLVYDSWLNGSNVLLALIGAEETNRIAAVGLETTNRVALDAATSNSLVQQIGLIFTNLDVQVGTQAWAAAQYPQAVLTDGTRIVTNLQVSGIATGGLTGIDFEEGKLYGGGGLTFGWADEPKAFTNLNMQAHYIYGLAPGLSSGWAIEWDQYMVVSNELHGFTNAVNDGGVTAYQAGRLLNGVWLFQNPTNYGGAGQFLRTLTDGSTEWADAGGTTNASGIYSTLSPSNYATAGADADSHFAGIDFSLGLRLTSETDPVVGAITGLVMADGGGNISAATSATDYAPSTGSSTAILMGDGAGAFADATADTDYATPSYVTLENALTESGITPVADDTYSFGPEDDIYITIDSGIITYIGNSSP